MGRTPHYFTVGSKESSQRILLEFASMVDVKDLRKEKKEVQAQGVIERKTYTEQWKKTQRRKSSDLGPEMPKEQNQWTPALADVNAAAQRRAGLKSWGTAGQRKDTVQHSKN
ncbi:hypothetical protein DUI87_09952 [Hirundo rustica rustica]|uniref:Uncharacterized protein n=1 Tax=Hirundo rustica rustica TaxID=333673 RepID=A0A3M0KZ66_HIRRU|nr:hypothetical protein DUI87_09952 [Hirundo rustica rustica]